MNDALTADRKKRNRTLKSYGAYVVVLCLALVTAIALERFTARSAQVEQMRALERYVEDAVVLAGERLAHYKLLTENLVAYTDMRDVPATERFEALAGVVSRSNESIINIALSQNYVVTHVFPLAPNRAALGLDFRSRPDLLPDVDRVLRSGEPLAVGPVRLVQGGTGIIIRAADGDADHIMHSVVLGIEPFLAEIGLGSDRSESIVSVRAVFPGTNTQETIIGEKRVWDSNPIVRTIQINSKDALDIGIIPKSGWFWASPYRLEIFCVVTLLLAIALSGVYWARRLIVQRIEARRQLVAAINASEDAFVIYDENDRLLLCNEKYKEYYPESADLFEPGTSFEHIIREGVARGQYPEASGQEEKWIEKRLSLHKNPTDPVEQQMPDGRWLKVAEAKSPDGYTVGFRVDITRLKTAIINAEEASRARTDFLNNVSHEFRTPLSIVLGYIAFLKNVQILPRYRELSDAIGDAQPARDKLDAFADDIITQAKKTDRSGKHLMTLIDSVLDWSTLSGGHVELVQTDVDLNVLLEGLCEELQEAASDKELALRYTGIRCVVNGDEVRLRQVFMNLISNAIKFTDAGYVEVALSRSGGLATVQVKDTGVGIPDNQRETVFERFAQVDMSTKRKYGGAGLGLAICNSLVELHGGTIALTSSGSEGSVFTVTLQTTEASDHVDQEHELPRLAS